MSDSPLLRFGFVLGGIALGSFLTLSYHKYSNPNPNGIKEKAEQTQEDSEEGSDESSDFESGSSDTDHEEHKMILAVNMSLKMKPGKVAAQCGHATLGCYRKATKQTPQAVRNWKSGEAKICIQVPNLEQMEDITKKCREAGITTYCVVDAGRTQIPAGSRTVLAIGPAPVSKIDPITRSFKLYG